MTWMLKRVTDYWDQQVGAVYAHAQQLEGMDPAAREAALDEIATSVSRHAQALNDELLARVGFIMVEDLYKAVCALSYWDDSIAEYLAASAGVFCDALAARGFQLRYVIDNAYEANAAGLSGPAEWFPLWFTAAGLNYICPQHLAFKLMESRGREPGAGLLAEFIVDGRGAGRGLVDRCLKERGHYVFLDTDATDASLAPALSDPSAPGSILVFRKEAPVPGSKCVVNITPPS